MYASPLPGFVARKFRIFLAFGGPKLHVGWYREMGPKIHAELQGCVDKCTQSSRTCRLHGSPRAHSVNLLQKRNLIGFRSLLWAIFHEKRENKIKFFIRNRQGGTSIPPPSVTPLHNDLTNRKPGKSHNRRRKQENSQFTIVNN